jgi:hypothetical protein
MNLGLFPDLAARIFEVIKKAETANVRLIWEDAEVIVKFSVMHKPYQTSRIGEMKR